MSGEMGAELSRCCVYAVGSPPNPQQKRPMMGGMSAAFGSRRDTSDAARAAPLRGVSGANAGASMVSDAL